MSKTKAQSISKKVIIDCTQEDYSCEEEEFLFYALKMLENKSFKYRYGIERKARRFAKELASDMLHGKVVIVIEPV